MFIDKIGQFVLNENDICELYYNQPLAKPKYIITDEVIKNTLELENFPNLVTFNDSICDKDFQKDFFLSNEYKEFDIAKFVLDSCKNDVELQRAGEELLLFEKHNMFELLNYLKYFVDTLRKNNILHRVGRGSSVASFVLYIIGVHRVNPIFYDIPITEFFKE